MPGDEDAVTLGDRMQVTPDEGVGIAGRPDHLNGVAQTFGWVWPTASRGRGTDAAGALSAWFWSLASRLVRSEESPQSRVVGGVEFELHSPSGDRDR